MEPGRVVEFIEGRSFLTGLVTRVKGGKLLVLSETDKEMSVSANRVLHQADPGLNSNQPRNDLVRHLQELSERRRQLSYQLNLLELWELLDGEGEEFSYDFLAELAWSGPTIGDYVAATLRAVFADGVYFKMRPEIAVRHSAEKVEQILLAKTREEEKARELDEGSVWLSGVWSDDFPEEPACRDRIVKVLTDMAVNGPEARDYKWGQKLLEEAGLGSDAWKPFHLLVKLGEMGRHENLELRREQVSTEFSPEILAEAEALAGRNDWQNDPTRRDLTDLDILTADSGGARDYDDAVSLENKDGRLFLGVHIADVSALIEPDTGLDREAMFRATSIYMPDQRIPMLPEVLSEECLSLKEDEIRPAFSMMAELSESGDILGYEFFPSFVKVKRQLSYQEVDGAVGHDLVLGRMFDLSQNLKAQRVANGAMILPLPKLNVFLTPEGEIGTNLTLWENPGRAMISEFMILANHLAARLLSEKEMPCYYRSQAEPSQKIVPGDTDCEDLFPCLKQRRFLSRVNWGLKPQPHTGMGLVVYTNLTSPLRRYIDLIIQRQVRSLISSSTPLYPRDVLGKILPVIETSRRTAMRLQNNRRRYWLIRYIEGLGHREFEAVVYEKTPYRWRIFITDFMMDADLPLKSGQTLDLGETISVRVKKMNAREDILKFELV